MPDVPTNNALVMPTPPSVFSDPVVPEVVSVALAIVSNPAVLIVSGVLVPEQNDRLPIVQPSTATVAEAVSAPVTVVAGVIVTAPVETEPMPIVPVESALIVRFAAPLLSVTAMATVPL